MATSAYLAVEPKSELGHERRLACAGRCRDLRLRAKTRPPGNNLNWCQKRLSMVAINSASSDRTPMHQVLS